MVRVRAGEAGDAAGLTDLAMRSKAHWGYDDAFMEMCRDELSWTPARIAENIVHVAEEGGALLGFSALLPRFGDGIVEAMFMAPEAMGRGIGRILWDEMVAGARTRGVPRIILDADPNAAPFYERMGCGLIGESPSGSIPGRMLPHYGLFLPGRVTGTARTMRLTGGGIWPFEAGNAADIARHWEREAAANPALYNGRVLITLGYEHADGHLEARLAEASYAAFLYWRHMGCPDRSVLNMFGSAVVLSADNALLLGKMARHTANAGLVYPFGGSLEPGDVGPDGRADIGVSTRRELTEETGLSPSDAEAGDPLVIADGPRLSIAQPFRFDLAADALAERIRWNAAAQNVPEIEDVVILRSKSDIDARLMPGYTQALATHFLP